MNLVKKYAIIWLFINLLGLVLFWIIMPFVDPTALQFSDFMEMLNIFWVLYASAIFSLPAIILFAAFMELGVRIIRPKALGIYLFSLVIGAAIAGLTVFVFHVSTKGNLDISMIHIAVSYIGAAIAVVALRFRPSNS